MVERPFWEAAIRAGWEAAPLVWLAGVRRVGKTTLARQTAPDALYLNCDLPSVGDMVRDPELFFRGCRARTIVFDEIHQLPDPSRLLKIGTDEFPNLRLLATGSSTLAASQKFTDALTGRKRVVRLQPLLYDELETFGVGLAHRLHRGGLPPAALGGSFDPSFYREWLDSFFARDVQRLFNFRSFEKFNTTFEYLLRQSGGLLDVAKTSTALSISRPTVEHYVRALEVMQGITMVRPFFGGGRKELVKSARCYGFDTGFVVFCNGWDPPRPTDAGILWEHVVLEYLHAHGCEVHYWRDTAGHEVDFVLRADRDTVDAIECKWDPNEFEPGGLRAFRSAYPQGRNYVLSPTRLPPHSRMSGGLEIHVCTPSDWAASRPG
ncbi:MAG TPA: ATP-binding protein [Candidatus Xenobia bacterium]|jgi:hypothetical protein